MNKYLYVGFSKWHKVISNPYNYTLAIGTHKGSGHSIRTDAILSELVVEMLPVLGREVRYALGDI